MGFSYPCPRRWTKAEDYVVLPPWLKKADRVPVKYYFHLREGSNCLRDEDGVVLPDLEAVKAEAARGAKSILAAHRALGTEYGDSVIQVETEQGYLIFELPLRQVRYHELPLRQPVGIAIRPR